MYRVKYIDGKETITRDFSTKWGGETYARCIHDILNVQVSVIKVSEELVLSLLPR
jgi:hypothetical protein